MKNGFFQTQESGFCLTECDLFNREALQSCLGRIIDSRRATGYSPQSQRFGNKAIHNLRGLMMKRVVFFAFITFSIFLHNSARSEESEVQCNYEGTQTQMNACAFRDFSVSDKELNRVYKKLIASLSSKDQGILREEQRAWLKKRDPKCNKEADDEAGGGSMRPLIFYVCLEEATKVRVQQLRQWKK